jgi:hypothetical protein
MWWNGRVNRAAAAITAGAAALAVTLGAWPAVARLAPPCPLHAATGLDCPGCGMTRAVVALVHGDVTTALGYNVVAVGLLLPLLALVWWSWLWQRPAPKFVSAPAFLPALIAVLGAFTLARNLPLAPLEPLAA